MANEAERSERCHEGCKDSFCLAGERPKFLKARLSRTNRLSAKHYAAGVAYLGWKETILHPAGHRYEARLAARRMEGSIEDYLAIGKAHPDVRHCLGGDHDLVLVSYVEAMAGKQRAISSVVWLGLPYEAGSFITGSGAKNLALNSTFEFWEVPDDREVAAAGITSPCRSAGHDQMIERGSQVVKGITHNQWKVGRGGSPRADAVTVSLRHWMHLWPGQTGIAVKKSPEIVLDISDVAFGPLHL